jgi:hypothetical protein
MIVSAPGRAFHVQSCLCVSDGNHLRFSDEPEKMQLGTRIIFGIATKLERAIIRGPLAIAYHLTHHD